MPPAKASERERPLPGSEASLESAQRPGRRLSEQEPECRSLQESAVRWLEPPEPLAEGLRVWGLIAGPVRSPR